MNDDFKNPYPDEFGFYRIGTPINADINRANPDCPAFDMRKLNEERCIMRDANPISVTSIQGGGCDSKSQNAWGFSSDSQINIRWFVNASVSFHMNQSKNSATSKSTQTITAYAKQETNMRLRMNLTDKQLLGCATPDFLDKLQRIRNEALARKDSGDDGEKLRAAYSEFYKVYGTGFVSKLVLGAIGVFKGWASYESSASELSSNFGGGASISGVCGGVSAAVEYCKNNMDLNANGKFEAKAFGMPAGSDPEKWATGFLTIFADTQLNKLDDLKAWQTAYEQPVEPAKAPEIERVERKEPPIPDIPSFNAGEIANQIKDMKIKQFRKEYKDKHKTEPPINEYEEYINALKDVAKKTNVQDVAKPQKEPSREVSSMAMAFSPKDLNVDQGYSYSHFLYGAAPASGISDVDFGSYGVVGYEYTPWEKIFPELKPIAQEITQSQISIGLAMAWLSTRQVIAQYFRFCATFFPDVAPEGTGPSASAFQFAIDDISSYVLDSFESDDCNIIELHDLESKFRERLKARKFSLMGHYQLFIDNYAWLKEVPFGAAPIVDIFGRYYYQPYKTSLKDGQPEYKHEHITDITSPASTLMERSALRLYPIISTDMTGPFFFWTSVEIVEHSGEQPERAGASLVNEFRTPSLPDWGMCRVLGPTETPGNLVKSFTDKNKAVPKVSFSNYTETPWKLEHTSDGPKARLYATSETKLVAKNWNELNNIDIPLRLVCQSHGLQQLSNDDNRYYRVFLGEPIGKKKGRTASGLPTNIDVLIYPELDIYLVPVDYQDAKNAKQPPGGFQGGGPMWRESMTDELIGAINALGK